MWNRLKNMKCPKCNHGISSTGLSYECNQKKCTFKIGIQEFNDLVGRLYKKTPSKTEEDNQVGLNNL